MTTPRETVAERRRKVLVGELPVDFLRLPSRGPSAAADGANVSAAAAELYRQQLQQTYFVPPNTRGRISVTIVDANLVKNYGLVRMDPYCRLRVGSAVFETPTQMSGGKSPFWNRIVHAYLPNGVESIYVQIYDERAFTADECVAFGHIVLPPAIFNGETIDDYYPLSGQQGEGKEGMIHLVISFQPAYNAEDAAIAASVVAASEALPAGVAETLYTEEEAQELHAMFPTVDVDVIKCILEEKRGNKDATVTALLEMTN